MFSIRVSAFTISLLLALEYIEPRWEWFAVLGVLGFLAMREELGVAFVVISSLLAFEVMDAEQAWMVVLSVLSGASALRQLLRGTARRPRPEVRHDRPRRGFQVGSATYDRLRRWADGLDA